MPELPEVEHLRRSLDPWLVGARLGAVEIRRRDVATRATGAARRLALALLEDAEIVATHRHGKQIAIEARDGRALVIQLGMTGSVAFERDDLPEGADARHRHVVWRIDCRRAAGRPGPAPRRMSFRDPRRFGGLTAHPSMDSVRTAWAPLGPDALSIDARTLADRLAGVRRPAKSALLDQGVLAGVGNIYADEALHAAGIHPLHPAGELDSIRIQSLARSIQRILARAVRQGGSTLRDYRDAFGQPGTAVQTHRVYGRAGEPCLGCGRVLEGLRIVGRATVCCPGCQDLSTCAHRATGDRRHR